jgi:hypothetical protein
VISLDATLTPRPPARPGLLLLAMLLSVDLLLVGLHLAWARSDLVGGLRYSLGFERGYGEYYLYLKLSAAAGLIAWRAFALRRPALLAWSLLLAAAVLDDGWQLHERWGEGIAAGLGLSDFLSLRGQDWGEILAWSLAGLPLLGALSRAYRLGDPAGRRFQRGLFLCLAVLVFFAVGMDAVHQVVSTDRTAALAATVLEDGGELVTGSVILWFIVAARRDLIVSPPGTG